MAQRPEDRIAAMLQARGYLLPFHRVLAEQDPDFLDSYNVLVGKALVHGDPDPSRPAGLPAKYRELVVSALLAFRGEGPGLEAHIRRALSLGATPEEVVSAFESALIPGGAPTMKAGLEALAKVLEDARLES
ncbi:MAG: carboxymuconolactone decarboxylase family protein [Actinomycetia bacterium]|nr:carboxymuconolactone decarboxylase family protein [Actinomycetes bacterium]